MEITRCLVKPRPTAARRSRPLRPHRRLRFTLPAVKPTRASKRALELYHAARTQRDERIRAFEAEYGRADRIDHSVLADLQRIQARLAAIAARQQRANATGGEPKVAKFVDQIGTMIVGY